MTIEKLARADLLDDSIPFPAADRSAEVLRLNCNENPAAPANASDPLINRYPENQPADLIQRLAEIYEVESENLLVTRGADDGIDALIRAFCQPTIDSVVHCNPTFVMYGFFAKLHAVDLIDVPLLDQEHFDVDFAALAGTTAKLVFLCNPNNPTGSTIDARQVLEFADSVRDRCLVVVDEAYIEFAEAESLATQATQSDNLVVLRTLSKVWGLAGARLGVVIGNPELIRYLNSTVTPYPLSRSSVTDALSVVDAQGQQAVSAMVDETRLRRNDLAEFLTTLNFVDTIYPSQANFLLVRVQNAMQLMRAMNDRDILIRDQSRQRGLDQCVRISIGSKSEMAKLKQALSEFANTACEAVQ